MATEIDFRVKNGLVVGTNATITGTVTANTFIGDGSSLTGLITSVSYSTITGTVPTWNQNTTGTAAGLSTTLAVASGGTGVTSSTGTGSVVLSASPTFTGTVSGITATMVGLGNVANTAQVTSVTGTTPISSSGGLTPDISISAATTSVAGSMSSADKTKLDAISGTNTGDQTSVSGNAGTATILATARNINGVSFDGSANVTINAVDSTARIASSLIGAASGVAPLDASSKILATYLPSYVDDVLEYANLAGLPETGETGKIYVALDTNKTYRWSGSAYIYITSGAVDSVAGKTGVVTLTSSDVGLGNVTNNAAVANLSGTNTGDQTIPTTLPASDVYSWAKAATKPTYTYTEVGAQVAGTYATGTGSATGTNTGDETSTTIKSALGITTLSGSNTGDQTSVSGNAGTATSISGGVLGSIPYQTAASTTALTAAGTTGQVLTTVTTGAAPTWQNPTGGGGTYRTVTTVIPTIGQTVFTIAYTVGYIDVFYNGVKLVLADDFVATNGTSITLTSATISGDTVEFVTYANIALTDTYSKTQADTLFAPLASPTFTGTVSGITATMVGLGNVTNNAAVANLSGTNTGDQILPTTLPASDVSAWAKEATKPTYTASEVGLGNVDNTTDLLKPISTATQTALDLKSPLASPTFTGTPSVPTATVGTNTTQIASTAYVRAEVSALVASAPTALDTLNELATALGNDANFSTTVTTALGLKAPLASPTFTGTVTSPTFVGSLTGTSTGLSVTLAVASGGTGVTTSSGTGNNVLSTSPTLVTPILGTPTSGTLTNCTFPTFNQNTTGNAATFTSTIQNSQFNSVGVGTAASATAGEIRATNNITAYYSDKRLKENITLIPNALEKVLSISGVTFTANDLAETFGYTDRSVQVGVIAQEIESVLPQIVVPAPFDIGKNEDGTEYSISGENYKTVQYEKLVPLLIEAIKELSDEVNKLKGVA